MKKHPLLWFFLLTFLITWGLAGLFFGFQPFYERIFGKISATNPVFILAVWGPNIAAVIMTLVAGERGALKALLKRFIPVKAGIWWYLAVIVLIPLSGSLINLLTGTPLTFTGQTPALSLSMMLAILISGPLGEELGWRGYALPRMLEKRSALAAGLLLGLIWGLWHLPTFFTPGLPQAGLQIPAFILSAVSLSVIVTWIFVNTGQNLFFIFLFHYFVNFTFSLIGTKFLYVSGVFILVALIVILLYGKELKVKKTR
ncbi:MAG: type II CAAX prenyl endopeptidase Rce1 family protein [Bacteroidota bacterium]